MKNRIELAIEALRQGRMVIVADDDDRECEGDFIMSAALIRPEDVNLMALKGRGLICCAIDETIAARLDLRVQTGALHATAFTESVDLLEGVTTGISCADRALGLQRLADPQALPGDFARPGHLFPLVANPDGVLGRRGHTEAAVDLCRFAGLPPAGVVCEIMNPDGTMARGAQLTALAAELDMPFLTVEDLAQWRKSREVPLAVLSQAELPTPWGTFTLHSLGKPGTDPDQPVLLLTHGLENTAEAEAPVLVRVHSECATGDLFGSLRCDCGPQLHRALEKIAAEGRGALVYLRQEGRGIGLTEKLKAYALQDQGLDTFAANRALGHKDDHRDYWEAAQALKLVGVNRIRLLTGNPHKKNGLENYGITVEAVEALTVPANPHNEKYLKIKGDHYAHS